MITLLVSTMDRSEFVIRLLKYYESLSFEHLILIGDSSTPEEFNKTQQYVDSLGGKLKVRHYHYPNFNTYSVTYELMNKVDTPYTIFLPDDDFFVPGALDKCVEFLEENSDYSSAWGDSILFNLHKSGAYGEMNALSSSNEATKCSIEKDTAQERLLDHIDHYTSVFAGVCRTGMYKKAFRNARILNSTAQPKDVTWGTATQFGELLASASLVVEGKSKSLDVLFWIRQGHDQRYLVPDRFKWVSSSNWFVCFEIFIRQVKEDLIEKEGVSEKESEAIARQIIEIELSRGFYLQYAKKLDVEKNAGKGIKEKIKQNVSLFKFLKGLRDSARSVLSKAELSKSINLQSVLNKNSRYYKDFMPVYNLVTGKEK